MRGKNSLIGQPDQHCLYIIGSLKPAVHAAAVEPKLNVALQFTDQAGSRLSANDSARIAQQHITLTPAGGGVAGMKNQYAEPLQLLRIVSGLVLLIACANIANLLAARGMTVRVLASIRLALGAPRGRLVRRALTESVVLAFARRR